MLLSGRQARQARRAWQVATCRPRRSTRPPSFMRRLIIAIDGPSGAGKGTVARAVAAELGYRHVDSGAMYRAIGWKALRDGVPFEDEAAVAALADASRIAIDESRVEIDGI